MTDFYTEGDQFFWPIKITDKNNRVEITEDVDGDQTGEEENFSVRIPTSSELPDDTYYYAIGNDDPCNQVQDIDLINENGLNVTMRSLYAQIAESLSSGSPKNFTYQFTSGDISLYYDSMGIQIELASSDVEFEFDPRDIDTVNPGFFGYESSDNFTHVSTEDGELEGDKSRFGHWRSPKTPSDRRHRREADSEGSLFEVQRDSSSEENVNAPSRIYRSSNKLITRHLHKSVASPHVWRYDRVNKSDLRDKSELEGSDNNNAFITLWKDHQSVEGPIVAVFGRADQDLNETSGDILAGEMTEEWSEVFNDCLSRSGEYRDELYDVVFEMSVYRYSHYSSGISVYRH